MGYTIYHVTAPEAMRREEAMRGSLKGEEVERKYLFPIKKERGVTILDLGVEPETFIAAKLVFEQLSKTRKVDQTTQPGIQSNGDKEPGVAGGEASFDRQPA